MPVKKSKKLRLGTRVRCEFGEGSIYSNIEKGYYEILLDKAQWIYGMYTQRFGDFRRNIQVI
ncbi:MAG: hypothetical protein PHE88_12290 [Elusimicrobia bacterium]|nr:hypothetical protein [Elusimicrobiota bacterium]